MDINVAKSELSGPPRIKVASLVYEALAVVAVGVFLAVMVI